MSFTFEITQKAEHLRHGGREVLTLCLDLPTGDTPAAQHLQALALCLADYAKEKHLSEAVSALEAAVAAGRPHGFFPYRYRVKCKKDAPNGRLRLTLIATLTAGNEVLYQRTLQTLWSADGALQFPLDQANGKAKKRGRSKKALSLHL